MNDVDASCNTDLKAGDEVEFLLTQNQRNGKYSAVKVKKIGDASLRYGVMVIFNVVDTIFD
jgi:hypothetical protein